MILTAAQLRAARGLLDWTRTDLAKAANISPETVKNIEHGTFRPQEQTADAIIKAFAAHDVVFTVDEGVKKHRDPVKTFSGREGYREYLDHIYSSLKNHGGVIRQFNISDKVLAFGQEYSALYMEKMATIANLDARVLVKEGDSNFPAAYCTYRWLQKQHWTDIPYYVYGNNVSMASFQDEKNIEIISICSDFMANIYLQHFDGLWESSLVANKKRDK